MGGQTCVFYGAAQFSKNIGFTIPANEENSVRLHAALAELQAEGIAIPRFGPGVLERRARSALSLPRAGCGGAAGGCDGQAPAQPTPHMAQVDPLKPST